MQSFYAKIQINVPSHVGSTPDQLPFAVQVKFCVPFRKYPGKQPNSTTVPSTVSFDDLKPLSGSENPRQKIADVVDVVLSSVVGSG